MSKKENTLKTISSNLNSFSRRHIGIDQKVSAEMLKDIGFSKMDDFIQSIVPKNIYSPESLSVSSELSEEEALRYICLLYTSPSPRDLSTSRMPSSA